MFECWPPFNRHEDHNWIMAITFFTLSNHKLVSKPLHALLYIHNIYALLCISNIIYFFVHIIYTQTHSHYIYIIHIFMSCPAPCSHTLLCKSICAHIHIYIGILKNTSNTVLTCHSIEHRSTCTETVPGTNLSVSDSRCHMIKSAIFHAILKIHWT